jgi:hypothetical protein
MHQFHHICSLLFNCLADREASPLFREGLWATALRDAPLRAIDQSCDGVETAPFVSVFPSDAPTHTRGRGSLWGKSVR